MSPATRSKSKDKKAAKEPPKAASKPSTNANSGGGGGIPTSGYNPLLGTFHTLETSTVSAAPPLHVNGRFRNIDDTEDHIGNSFGTGVEYDSVSNTGSWSGESEDQKEKMSHPTLRQDAIPGADSDKREKIRQKNEKKHQRQKERRAQELHERCTGYLMSRKLEALAQQLVAMGFSSERATMALILNEGRVEESVAWLFEGGEGSDTKGDNLDGGGNLKIDISEELARISDMEIRFKCSKQEVERALVACEGDLEKAAETLRMQKQDHPSSAPLKPEETGDPPAVGSGKLLLAVSQNSLRVQPKAAPSASVQQKRDDKDFNYTKVTVPVGSSVETGSKNPQALKKIQTKLEWSKPQHIAVPPEKSWPVAGSNPSVSYSLASPLQASPPLAKTESRYVATVGNELKNLQLGMGSVREPVIMMQRPQSFNNVKQQMPIATLGSSPPGTVASASWMPNSLEMLKPNGLTAPMIPSTKSVSLNSLNTNQLYSQFHRQQQQVQQQYVSSSGSVDPAATGRGNGLWNRGGTSPALAAASSLGLFSGLGSNGSSGSSSPVDWSVGGSMLHYDYTNIDWSLDLAPSSSRAGGLWQGMGNSYMQSDTHMYDSYNSGVNVRTALRPVLSNVNGVSIGGLEDGGLAASETSASGSREWASPFEEKDIFSLPRQFVSSPSL